MTVGRIGVFCLVLLLLGSTRLSATIITETVNGTVTSGTDVIGLFGPQGANLAGDSATITYVLNVTEFIANGLFTQIPSTEEQFSDSMPDSALTNTITINGKAFTQTLSSGSATERFTTSQSGTGSLVDSLLFNSTNGMGSEIKETGATPYQFGVLSGNPTSFLNLVSANASTIFVGLDATINGLMLQDDINITPSSTSPTPEPSPFILLTAVGLLLALRKRDPGASRRLSPPKLKQSAG